MCAGCSFRRSHEDKKFSQEGRKRKTNQQTGIVFEKLQDAESNVKYDSGQNGGTKRRVTIDSWIILGAQIDEGRRMNKPVYIFFADVVKCFDRLWLRDCLVDLHDCGMREREVAMVYKLNKEARFKVDTPSGVTKEVKVKEIVKQGTVFGPKLCCASTGKINHGLHSCQPLYPGVTVQAITFMDDIIFFFFIYFPSFLHPWARVL